MGPTTARRRRAVVVVAMAGAASMVVIDQTSVSVALPSLQRSLNMTETQMLWVVNAYVLAMASLVAVGGRLGDLFGRVRVFRVGALAFMAGSVAAGAATATWWVLGARVLQGAGAAAMLPTSMAIIVGSVPEEARGRALGVATGISMSVLAAGPFLGGFLTQVVSWRAVFFVNVPIGMCVVALSVLAPPGLPVGRRATVDWLGIGLLAPGLVAVILALMQGTVWGWGSPVLVITLGAGVLLLAAFALVEPRRDHPLIDMGLFRLRNFNGDSAVRGLMQFSNVGVLVLGALWVQNVLDFSPIQAGLSLLPLTIPLVVVSPLAGRLYDRVGARAPAAAGALAFGVALLWMAAVLGRQSYAWVVPAYLVMGAGVGLAMVPVTTDAMAVASASRHGQASGVFATVSEIGGSLGLAVLGAVVATGQRSRIDAFLGSAGVRRADMPGIERFLAESAKGRPQQVPHGLPAGTFQASANALTSATADALAIAGALMLLAAATAWVLLRRTGDSRPGVPAPARDSAPAGGAAGGPAGGAASAPAGGPVSPPAQRPGAPA